jgi:hypothetical protein
VWLKGFALNCARFVTGSVVGQYCPDFVLGNKYQLPIIYRTNSRKAELRGPNRAKPNTNIAEASQGIKHSSNPEKEHMYGDRKALT